MDASLHKIWWLWIPLAFIAVQAIIEMALPGDVVSVMHSENGPHETLQFLIMVVACFVASWTLPKIPMRDTALWLWVFVASLCCFYVAGEEISWGQHVLDWSTPEFWQGINDQGETNLHNTSSWFDQKPRLILLIGVVTGGLLIPLLLRYKPDWVPQKFTIIYPPAILGVTAACAVGTNLLDKIAEAITDNSLLVRGSEVEELYLFYFVLLYLIVLRRRILMTFTSPVV